MFLIKAIFLLSITFIIPAYTKEEWIILPLADSYEHEILNGEGALTMHQYWESFRSEGAEILHLEVQKELAIFKNEEDLKKWIGSELAPLVEAEKNPQFIEKTFILMKEHGWITLEEGKIAFPRKTLLVLLKKEVH